jgi:hypothetical protein
MCENPASLNLQEPPGPIEDCTGIALPLILLTFLGKKVVTSRLEEADLGA